MKVAKVFLAVAAAVGLVDAAFWMEGLEHKGISAFNPDGSYKVFRNVQEFGAKGDGVTDDTAAINKAISSGNRCGGLSSCNGSTITPAVVYFPAGKYIISQPIVNFYYTQLIGDANELPIIKASKDFQGSLCMVDSNPYIPGGDGATEFAGVNLFFRQIRNFVFDTTDVPGEQCAVHWPAGQATSIQNCVFKLSTKPKDAHTGIFMENGSGGVLADLIFHGGKIGASFGNQQYTTRNLTFIGCQTGITQVWNWGWTYKSLNFQDCNVGIDMNTTNVGSVTLLDSTFQDVNIAIRTSRRQDNVTGQGSLMVSNVEYIRVPTVLQGPDGDVFLAGWANDTVFDPGYATGKLYAPYGPNVVSDRTASYFTRPLALQTNKKYYERSKPQYETSSAKHFLTARSFGALGDGKTDDTEALNALFRSASNNFTAGMIAFVDAGHYKVSDTIYVPPNVRIVGEALSAVILGSGPKFSNIDKPYPVVQIGKPGEVGYVEMSDMIISTQGAMAGAVLIEYNLKTPFGSNNGAPINPCTGGRENNQPSGLWDVHVRVGGFQGSDLQVAKCLKSPASVNIKTDCIAAYMSMHITKSASNLYMENNWLWVADHDMDDATNTQIDVYAGRGLLVESTVGSIWLVGTSVEHHTLYQYQLVGTTDVFMGQIQTETPYYQPGPAAPAPFTNRNLNISDPDFDSDCASVVYGSGVDSTPHTVSLPGNPTCKMAWGLRILGSQNIVVYGAGLYSFFNNYDQSCIKSKTCQARMFSIGPITQATTAGVTGLASDEDGYHTSMHNIEVYNLNTVGSSSMITRLGNDIALGSDNFATFASTINVFHF